MANARLAITPKNHKGNSVNQLSPKETKNPLPNPDKGVSQDLNVSKKIPLNPPFSKGEAGEHLEQSSGHIVLPPSFAKGGVGGGFSSSSQLPPGWTVLSCGDAFDQISTTKAKIKTKDTLSEGLFPVVDQGLNFIAGYIDDEDKVLDVDEPVCVFGDHTRIIKWVDFSFVPGADGTKVLTPKKHIHPRFFYYQLKSLEIVDRGYSRHFKYLKESVFVVPPLPEQIRIANKLDSILAKVDNAQARLEKIPTLLKRFRQAVLAAATSGELTREEYDAEKWGMLKISKLVNKIEAGKNIKCEERPPVDSEKGIVKISAVTWGVYNEEQSKTLTDTSLFMESRRVKPDDFLISRANTLELLGMPVIVHSVTKNLMLSDKVLRLVMPDKEKKWVNIFFRSPMGRKEIESRATGNQQSMRNIGQAALLDIVIPYPEEKEKVEIVLRVESLFALADSVEKQYKAAKQRLDRLTQAVLAKAFRGELVPQDPDDEPAAELLKRIQAQRTQQQTGKKRHAAS